ncbi:hypothetical protein B0H14DRAFT_3866325 [Mycena olivaceomarginata]|nr:hypothetical protein B0H14DRAFT_3866325 [Mycena olivaceomarginata]
MSGHNDSDEETYFAGGARRSCDSQSRTRARRWAWRRSSAGSTEEGARRGRDRGSLTARGTLGGEGIPSAYVPGAREEVEVAPFLLPSFPSPSPLLSLSTGLWFLLIWIPHCSILFICSRQRGAGREEAGCQYKHERRFRCDYE